MLITLILGTMTVMGVITAGANTAGTIHDKQIIDESLWEMQETVEQLQLQADQEIDPEKKRAKLRIAESLANTNDVLTEFNESSYKRNLSKEAFGLAKWLLSPGVEKISDFVDIWDTAVQTALAAKWAYSDWPDTDTKIWKNLANTSNDAEVAILIAKARQLTKETKQLNKELWDFSQRFRDEEKGKISSKELEKELGEAILNSNSAKKKILNEANISVVTTWAWEDLSKDIVVELEEEEKVDFVSNNNPKTLNKTIWKWDIWITESNVQTVKMYFYEDTLIDEVAGHKNTQESDYSYENGKWYYILRDKVGTKVYFTVDWDSMTIQDAFNPSASYNFKRIQ